MTTTLSTKAHQDWLRRISDYQSGDVSAAERATVEAHLATCASCRDALAAYDRFYMLAASPLRLGTPGLEVAWRPLPARRRALLHWPAWSGAAPGAERGPANRTRAGLAAGLVAALLIVSFLGLFAPRLGSRVTQPTATAAPTPSAPSATTAPGVTPTPTTTGPVAFVCANAAGSGGTYAYIDANGQLYRVTGCGAPMQLTHNDADTFAQPLAFSPTNRWLMASLGRANLANGQESLFCETLINPSSGASVKTPFCRDDGPTPWTEWPTFIGWLDDNTFLESLTHQNKTVSVVRVNATTFAKTPVAAITWVANSGSPINGSGMMIRGDMLYYGGYMSANENGAWLHRVSLTTGADTRIVRLGVAGFAGCQVGSAPCNWTGPWDVSSDGAHILYNNPGATVEPNDYGATEPTTPLYYARSDGSAPIRLFADQALGSGFPSPYFSPDGARVAWQTVTGSPGAQSFHGFIQALAGGAVVTLPADYSVTGWRADGKATLLTSRQGQPALYTLATGAITPLPGRGWSYVWGA